MPVQQACLTVFSDESKEYESIKDNVHFWIHNNLKMAKRKTTSVYFLKHLFQSKIGYVTHGCLTVWLSEWGYSLKPSDERRNYDGTYNYVVYGSLTMYRVLSGSKEEDFAEVKKRFDLISWKFEKFAKQRFDFINQYFSGSLRYNLFDRLVEYTGEYLPINGDFSAMLEMKFGIPFKKRETRDIMTYIALQNPYDPNVEKTQTNRITTWEP